MTDDVTAGPGRARRLTQMAWEAAAVLAAILVAFGLDAWWSARVERSSMLQALDAVAVELRQNLTALDSAVAFNNRQIQITRELVTKTPEDVAAMSDEDVVRFGSFPDHEILTLERGASTAFIQGGFLQAVSDDELRAVIAGIATVQDELDEEREGFRASDDRLLEATFDLLSVDDLGTVFGLDETRSYLLVLAESDTARRAAYVRAVLLGVYTEEMSRLRTRLSESLEAIERGRR